MRAPGADLARRDPAIPGLPFLLDPEETRRRLAALVGGAVVGPPRVEFARWKPGVSALVLSSATLEGGAEIRAYAKAYAGDRDAADAAKAASRLREGDERPFERLAVPRAIAFRFPFDAGLPGLRRLLGKDGVKRALARAVPARAREGWRAKGRGSSIETVRYKPENRFVFRVEARWRNEDGRGDRELLYGRLLPGDGARRCAAIHAAAGRARGVRLPGLAGFDAEIGCVLVETLGGRPLLDSPQAAWEETGRALAAFHDEPFSVPERGSAEARVEALRRELEAFAGLAEPWADEAMRVLDAIAPRLAGGRALVHGDFHADQVLVDAQGIGIVDLDGVRVAEANLDVGTFLAHLRLLVASGDLDAPGSEARAEAFLRGYGARPGPLAPWIALSLLDLGLSPLRRLEEGGSARAAAAVGEAAALLAPPRLVRAAIRKDGAIERELVQRAAGGTRRSWEVRSADGGVEAFADPAAAGPEGLRIALDPGRLAAALRERIPGAGAIEVARTELLSLRPGRRGVVRARLADGRTLVVKVHAPGRIPAAFPDAVDLLGPALPRRLGSDPESGLVFVEDLPGRPLADLLRADRADAAIRRTAAALRRFHGGPLPPGRRTLSGELDVASARHKALALLDDPFAEARANAIERLRALPAADAGVPLSRLHGDFYEAQVLVEGEGVAFLDLDLCAGGDGALDLGNFAAHLDLLELQGRAGAPAPDLAASLLDGYGPERADLGERIAAFRAVSLVRLSALQALQPDATEVVRGLLHRAREVACSAGR